MATSSEQRITDASLLSASAAGDIEGVRAALKANASPLSQDNRGQTALHMAAALSPSSLSLDTVKALIEGGVPWNASDEARVSAVTVALKASNMSVAQFLIEEGVRTELVLRALKEMEESSSDDDGGQAETCEPSAVPETSHASQIPNAAYLASPVTYSSTTTQTTLMDTNKQGVMMSWEDPIMRAHATHLVTDHSNGQPAALRVLNVGFGLGIVDTYFQALGPPTLHTIIEPHPDVYAHMLADSWHTRPGVEIIHARWQDALPKLNPSGYDVIFFDTYGEFWDDMRVFHDSIVSPLLALGGRYSFFNGLAATDAGFHRVAMRLAEVDLDDTGLDIVWHRMPVDEGRRKECKDGVWDDVEDRYWELDEYHLPICTWKKE